jgi:endoglucanase
MKANILLVIIALLLSLIGCKHSSTTQETEPEEEPPVTSDITHIKGVNWADTRDNFIEGWVIPSGLTASDDYAAVQLKADHILSGFIANMGANTVRLPINHQSILNNVWWDQYKGAADMALSKEMNVIFAYWEGKKDGRIDDINRFWAMWQIIVDTYSSNANVYYEIMNEPHGYGTTEWKDLASEWLERYPEADRSKVIVAGTGYSDHVVYVGGDSRFDSCLFAQHIYNWWGSHTTVEAWENELRQRIGPYTNRTIVTEYGAPMTTGLNYTADAGGDVSIAFIQGITNVLHADSIGSCYWPGLRYGDSYSIQKYEDNKMTTTNASGLSRIRYGWFFEE